MPADPNPRRMLAMRASSPPELQQLRRRRARRRWGAVVVAGAAAWVTMLRQAAHRSQGWLAARALPQLGAYLVQRARLTLRRDPQEPLNTEQGALRDDRTSVP